MLRYRCDKCGEEAPAAGRAPGNLGENTGRLLLPAGWARVEGRDLCPTCLHIEHAKDATCGAADRGNRHNYRGW